MKKLYLLLLLVVLGLLTSFHRGGGESAETDVAAGGVMPLYALYDSLHLEGRLSREAFDCGVEGYLRAGDRSRGLLTVIDFSKPSTAERLFVIDLDSARLLCVSHVSHGCGSGGLYATSFSNREGSHKSSLGFYLTDATYNGRNGYSLRLRGLERGINDNAMSRAIVIHGADYCNPALATRGVRLGRSWGCPALPQKVARQVIDMIKDGTLLFIYANDSDYMSRSKLLNG